jgi:hypothetical protein
MIALGDGSGGVEMRKALALICMILMVAGLAVMAGCADSGFSEVDVDEPIADGIQTNFIDQDANLVAFSQFGTFKLIVADQLVEGNYSISSTEDGYSLEMTFENGESKTWSIVITEGKVTTLIDDEGTQYTQQDLVDVGKQEDI